MSLMYPSLRSTIILASFHSTGVFFVFKMMSEIIYLFDWSLSSKYQFKTLLIRLSLSGALFFICLRLFLTSDVMIIGTSDVPGLVFFPEGYWSWECRAVQFWVKVYADLHQFISVYILFSSSLSFRISLSYNCFDPLPSSWASLHAARHFLNLSLPTPFFPSLLVSTTRLQQSSFSPINPSPYTCSLLAQTILSAIHLYVFYSKSSFCHFSSSLWSKTDLAWPN